MRITPQSLAFTKTERFKASSGIGGPGGDESHHWFLSDKLIACFFFFGFLFLLFTFELRCCAYLIPCHNHYLSDYDAIFLICGVAIPGRFVFRRVAIIFEMREVAPIEIEHQRLKKISATYQPRSRQQQRRWRGVVLVFLCRLGATRIE